MSRFRVSRECVTRESAFRRIDEHDSDELDLEEDLVAPALADLLVEPAAMRVDREIGTAELRGHLLEWEPTYIRRATSTSRGARPKCSRTRSQSIPPGDAGVFSSIVP